ncbi:hypothetical protein ACS3SW_16145 [Roseobacteraceae bacterium S113]
MLTIGDDTWGSQILGPLVNAENYDRMVLKYINQTSFGGVFGITNSYGEATFAIRDGRCTTGDAANG